jgi:tetratricopeptide (TPR) repeat protein
VVARFRSLVLLLATVLVLAQDVFVPPVPRGIGREGKTRTVKQPIPFPRENQRWIRIRSPHFDVLSNASEARTRVIGRDLESLASALTEASPRFEAARTPTTVFVFASRRESQPYFELLTGMEGTNVSGLYVRHGSGGAMFIDASRRSFERTATHELVHDLLRQGDVVPPLWLEEGLAEYVANAQITKKGVVAGLPITPHVNLLASTPTRSIEQMLAVKIESPEAMSSYFYAESWAAVHWLMRVDPDAFWPFLRDVEQGASVADALRRHYNRSLDDLQRGIYGSAHRSASVRLAGTAADVASEVAVVTRPALLHELGAFLAHVAGAETEMQRHFGEALRLDPRHAPTLAATGQFEAALAADPASGENHLRYAEFLLGPAVGDFAGVFQPTDPANFSKARDLAVAAMNLGADEARALGALGISYLGSKDQRSGIAALEKARQLAPWRMDYAIHLYAMYLRAGDRAKADALFASVFEHARDKQVAFAARNVLLEAETERANALAREGKLSEAAALVRSIAATIPDAAGRADLERQAAEIESVAVVNEHIRRYNDAVTFSNAGRKKDALAVLDELLAVATDPKVVRDAEKLRRDLRARK